MHIHLPACSTACSRHHESNTFRHCCATIHGKSHFAPFPHSAVSHSLAPAPCHAPSIHCPPMALESFACNVSATTTTSTSPLPSFKLRDVGTVLRLPHSDTRDVLAITNRPHIVS